jgi:hypothetical protein
MAPECVYDTLKGVANSPGHLQIADGRWKIPRRGRRFFVAAKRFIPHHLKQCRTVIENGPENEHLAMKNFSHLVIIDVGRPDGSRANEHARHERRPAPRAPTLIDSDSADFDGNGHRHLSRHVRVDDPQMKLTCALARRGFAAGRAGVREPHCGRDERGD